MELSLSIIRIKCIPLNLFYHWSENLQRRKQHQIRNYAAKHCEGTYLVRVSIDSGFSHKKKKINSLQKAANLRFFYSQKFNLNCLNCNCITTNYITMIHFFENQKAKLFLPYTSQTKFRLKTFQNLTGFCRLSQKNPY
jgi:hypothetical protein